MLFSLFQMHLGFRGFHHHTVFTLEQVAYSANISEHLPAQNKDHTTTPGTTFLLFANIV